MAVSRDAAETFALNVLGWLAGQDDLLPVFLGASGAGLADLKTRAGDPEFLASVLDFVLMDDAWVVAACTAIDAPFDLPRDARAALPGGAEVHWT